MYRGAGEPAARARAGTPIRLTGAQNLSTETHAGGVASLRVQPDVFGAGGRAPGGVLTHGLKNYTPKGKPGPDD